MRNAALCAALTLSFLFFPAAWGEEIKGELGGSFNAPSPIPQGFGFTINYSIGIKAAVSILDETGAETASFELSADGISLSDGRSVELAKGSYRVVERYTITATPDNPLLQGKVLGGESDPIEWSFTAEDPGIYELSVSATVTGLEVAVGGDLTLSEMGELGDVVPVELVASRNIMQGEEVKYSMGFSIRFSRQSSVRLVAKTEEGQTAFVVTGRIIENEQPAKGASVVVELVDRDLKLEVATDDQGAFKAVFTAPAGTTLAEAGDRVKVTYKGFEASKALTEEDVSRGAAEVNLSVDTVARIDSVELDKSKVRNGESFALRLTGEPGGRAEADLSELDTTRTEPVELPEISPGVYELRTIVSLKNEAPDGIKTVTVKLTDRAGNESTRTIQIELSNPPVEGERMEGEIPPMELISPFSIPKGFQLELEYGIETEVTVTLIKEDGTEEKIEIPPVKGTSLAVHKTLKLEKGSYEVKESYTVKATPTSPLFQNWGFEVPKEFPEWDFAAEKTGTYDLSINAVVGDILLELTGDMRITDFERGEETVTVKAVTTRNIPAGDKITLSGYYSVVLSKSTAIELIAEEEQPVVFVVSGGVIENGVPIPEAEVTVELVTKGLKLTVKADKLGIYRATFTAPQGTTLAEAGDEVIVSYAGRSVAYKLTDEDVSKGMAMVNLRLDTYTWIEKVELSRTTVKNGDSISITVIGEPNGSAEVDLSELDTTKAEPIPLKEVAEGRYRGTVSISEENAAENGVKTIRIKLTDEAGNSAFKTVEVTLKNPAPPAVVEEWPSRMKLLEGPARIWLRARGATKVTATILTPSGERIIIELTDPDGDGLFEAQRQLEEKGLHVVTIVAENPEGVKAKPVTFTINTSPWDVNLDGRVDILDLVGVARSYGRRITSPDQKGWEADVDSNGAVDIFDIALVAKHYGEVISIGAPPLRAGGVVLARPENGSLRLQRPMWALISDLPLEGIDGARSIELSDGYLLIGLGRPFNSVRFPTAIPSSMWGVAEDGGVVKVKLALQTALLRNYPNPFNPETWIPFLLAEEGRAVISIYDGVGRLVRRIDLGVLRPGYHVVRWDGRDEAGERLASGIYFIHLKAKGYEGVVKAAVLK